MRKYVVNVNLSFIMTHLTDLYSSYIFIFKLYLEITIKGHRYKVI